MFLRCLIVLVAIVVAVSSQAEPCFDNITAAIEAVVNAGVNIGEAVADCGDHKTAQCVADISNCGANLAAAGGDISKAVIACGGHGSQCVTDLFKLGKDLADASSDVSLAVANCVNSTQVVKCVLDVIDLAGEVDKMAGNIENAMKDCKANQTLRR